VETAEEKRSIRGIDGYPSELEGGPTEISLLDLSRRLARRRSLIVRAVLISTALATVAAFLLPPKYEAEAVFLTPQQSQPSLSAMAQLSGLGQGGALSGLSLLSGLGMRNPGDLYVGILESRTIADSLINKFHLKQVYGARDYFVTRKKLAHNTEIKAGRDTLIRIRVEDRDPHRAAELANAYVDALADQNEHVALTEASQRRKFFESQLAKEKDVLSDAEIALRKTQESTGLVAPGGQAEGIVRAVSQLNLQILAQEARVEAMKTYVTDNNPRLELAKRELSALRTSLSKLEQGNHLPGTPEVPTSQLPEAGLQYFRKYRDVKYHEALFEILSKQYEAARLDEARSSGLIQVIDRAVVPERKSWPPRTLIVLSAAILAALVSSFWAVLSQSPRRVNESRF
jgi:tyrosine-protein kinase Etk/Wzc